jgi:site-specific DNA-methyltransferase (adenine-specific)/site-specific DNA-methyltransferase (cytosine-N4-specific)
MKKLGEGDLTRHNSANESGFGRDLSKWVDKDTVLPSNVLSLALVGKNKGHPAVYPVDLPLFFIKLLCPENGLVVDPFGGSGTTGVAAFHAGKNSVIIDNNYQYYQEAVKRIANDGKAHVTQTFYVLPSDIAGATTMGEESIVSETE